MNNTSYIALSGQTSVWRQLDVVANNIANMNTPAYRRQSAVFTSYLASTPNNNALSQQQLAYAQDYGIETDTTQGPIAVTPQLLSRPLFHGVQNRKRRHGGRAG